MGEAVLRVAAAAKINLFLHVGERRADGFHELESLVAFAEAGDVLTFAHADALSLSVAGPFAAGLAGESDNLVLRAARALKERTGFAKGAAITLEKNLPVSSGIGGGSADAAATLKGLVRLWGLKLASGQLHGIAAALGSDVPVCVASETSWMEGRGERVDAAPALPPCALVLVNPGIAVPTGRVFGMLATRSGTGHSKPATLPTLDALLGYLQKTRNDLEAPGRAIAPVIGEILTALSSATGALLARMSGSGATCFGLFANDADASAAARVLKSDHPDWWIVPTRIAAQ